MTTAIQWGFLPYHHEVPTCVDPHLFCILLCGSFSTLFKWIWTSTWCGCNRSRRMFSNWRWDYEGGRKCGRCGEYWTYPTRWGALKYSFKRKDYCQYSLRGCCRSISLWHWRRRVYDVRALSSGSHYDVFTFHQCSLQSGRWQSRVRNGMYSGTVKFTPPITEWYFCIDWLSWDHASCW